MEWICLLDWSAALLITARLLHMFYSIVYIYFIITPPATSASLQRVDERVGERETDRE